MAANCEKLLPSRSALLILMVCSNLVHTMQVMYESFEQINSTDTAEFLGRVKKVNRTTAALNGQLIIKKPLNNDYKIKLDFWHSPLGNQQFNYYPMKIPPTGMCDFSNGFWRNYEQFYRDYVTNNLRIGECPMEPRTIQINNHLLDSKMFSEFTPNGLWKAHVTVQTDEGDGFYLVWQMRVYSDGHF